MKHLDLSTILIIIITLILFILALYFTGLTHNILLEAAVFLVSVKLIIMAYKSSVSSGNIERELKEIKDILRQNIENN